MLDTIDLICGCLSDSDLKSISMVCHVWRDILIWTNRIEEDKENRVRKKIEEWKKSRLKNT